MWLHLKIDARPDWFKLFYCFIVIFPYTQNINNARINEKQKAKEAKNYTQALGELKCAYTIIGCPVQLIRDVFFEIAFIFVVGVDTHLPRFEVLAYVLPHFDALTHLVIRVSSAFIFQTFAEVCYSVFVNRSSSLRWIFVKRT